MEHGRLFIFLFALGMSCRILSAIAADAPPLRQEEAYTSPSVETAGPDVPGCEASIPFRPLTSGPKAHWFAYYDKHQFDPSDRYVLGMEVGFEDRAPGLEDASVLGMVDLRDADKWIPFAESTAWCWQQGCMLQWLPGTDAEVIYNAREGDHYISVIQNVFTGEKRALPKPVYAVSPDGKTAVGLNFARVNDTRPGYGYAGIPDAGASERYPDNDGIYALDLVTGESRLIITLAQVATAYADETTDDGKHWFNHLLFNTDGSRFIFLHRWHRPDGKGRYTHGFTARPDGGDIFRFNGHGMVSHFIWRDPQHLLAWSHEPDSGNKFHVYKDKTDEVTVVGEGTLTTDGHCTYSPCGKWILSDTYPDQENMQTLMLYRVADGKRIDLGRFFQEKPQDIQLRCDLHPRWSRDGNYICIDSKCSGQRQMYLLDVAEILGRKD
jgi:hypothetical protein